MLVAKDWAKTGKRALPKSLQTTVLKASGSKWKALPAALRQMYDKRADVARAQAEEDLQGAIEEAKAAL
eukprot:9623265-Alexandrium_andersonii.AAC.1